MQYLSIVVPVYYGAKYLADLVEACRELKIGLSGSSIGLELLEVIFVDDESIDDSDVVCRQLSERENWVRYVQLSRNYGQHPCTIAGFSEAKGDWVASIDEDLQHPPMDILKILRTILKEKSDIGYGTSDSIHQNKFRDMSSKFAKKFLGILLGNQNLIGTSSFRVVRGSIARKAASVVSATTYLDVALAWFSQRIVRVPLKLTDQRFVETSESGYSVVALINHAVRLSLSGQIKLFRMGALLGAFAIFLAIIGGLSLLIVKLFFPGLVPIEGWTSSLLVTVLFGGISVFFLTILLEYVGFLSASAHGKPTFFITDRSHDVELDQAELNRFLEKREILLSA